MFRGVFIFCAALLSACSARLSSATMTAGAEQSDIVGGIPVISSDFIAASTVQVYKITAASQSVSSCTGNVVAEHVVLTAAHCVASAGEKNFIYFSTQVPADIFNFFQTQMLNENLRTVLKNAVAPGWQSNQIHPLRDWQDLALLKFTGELPRGYQALAIEDILPQDQQMVVIAGFGETNGIQQLKSNQLMKASVAVSQGTWSGTEVLLNTSQGRSSCHGDSGGPAFVWSQDHWAFFAIDSRSDLSSDPYSECTGNTIYTRLGAHLSWLQDQIQELN